MISRKAASAINANLASINDGCSLRPVPKRLKILREAGFTEDSSLPVIWVERSRRLAFSENGSGADDVSCRARSGTCARGGVLFLLPRPVRRSAQGLQAGPFTTSDGRGV